MYGLFKMIPEQYGAEVLICVSDDKQKLKDYLVSYQKKYGETSTPFVSDEESLDVEYSHFTISNVIKI